MKVFKRADLYDASTPEVWKWMHETINPPNVEFQLLKLLLRYQFAVCVSCYENLCFRDLVVRTLFDI